ncbi:MAG: T9SS type A sorting domain-containing protein [Aureispira sp.]
MKNLLNLLLIAGLVVLCTYSMTAQEYPFWLRDQGEEYNEYPTSIASTAGLTATVGFHEEDFEILDFGYNLYTNVATCMTCFSPEKIFVNWREEASANTWNALIYTHGLIDNQVDVKSVPQVDISSKGDVYVSFTFWKDGDVYVQDASGNLIIIGTGNGSYDLGVVKFDANGVYQWHIIEGDYANDFITDLDYNEHTNQLAIGGYVEGTTSLSLGGGAGNVAAITVPSPLGANFPYGNAFAAVYEDNGNNANFIWARSAQEPTYSTDVVQDNNGNVFLSGIYYETKRLAGIRLSNNYTNGGLAYNYFIMALSHNGGMPIWAESYGSLGNELDITADKHLRHSSLAINPKTSELFHAFESTGSDGGVFSEFGTYVNYIDPGNGGIINSITVGNTGSVNGTTYYGSKNGSPTYNPNIAVDKKGQVFISGNYLLSDYGNSALGIAFDELEIGGTYVNHGSTNAGKRRHPEAVGWYTAIIDMGSGVVFNENVNTSYLPSNSTNVYNQLPVYGTAYDDNKGRFFYSVLGFKYGDLSLDLMANQGTINKYRNNTSSTQQYDGLIVRSFIGNGQHAKPAASTTTQGTAHSKRTSLGAVAGANTVWLLSPNPVAAGASLLWKNELGTEVVNYIRLRDMTGRVVQEWQQPKATAQGFQLPLGELVAGTYLLEASGSATQQSTMVVVK